MYARIRTYGACGSLSDNYSVQSLIATATNHDLACIYMCNTITIMSHEKDIFNHQKYAPLVPSNSTDDTIIMTYITVLLYVP